MNKLFFISLLLLALNTYAEPVDNLNQQHSQLQQAQQQLQQQISKEEKTIQRLEALLEKMTAINTQEPIQFAGQSYSKANFQRQVKLIQQQLQQKQNWLKLSQQENELLNNRTSVIAWRIKTLAANQEELQ